MHKYWLSFVLSVRDRLAYKTQVLVWLLISSIPTIFMYFVFQYLGNGHEDKYYQSYFILIGIVSILIFVVTEGYVSETIESGQLSTFLMKPYSFLKATTVNFLATPVSKFILTFPVIAILLYYLARLGFVHFTPLRILLLLPALAGGYLIAVSLGYLAAFARFWFEHSYFLNDLYVALILFFGGAYVPTQVFSPQLYGVVRYLPFRFIMSFPVEILLGKSIPALLDFVILVAYLILLWILVVQIYKRGLLRYEAFGN